MFNTSTFPAALLALALALAGNARAEWQVWTLTETRHVLRSEPAAESATVRVAAACNEWVGFQILLRSDTPVTGVRLYAGDLTGPGGAVLRGSDARLYRQHQLRLETGTFRNDAFRPDWYPDPLIPFQHPVPGKALERARLTAVPMDLPAGETLGFWVDLYVPADAVPGDYHGTYRVTASGGRVREIPVTLTAWGFVLPQTPTLVTEFGAPRLRDYYRQRAKTAHEPEPADWAAVESQCARLLSEHRFNATPPRATLTPERRPDGSFEIPRAQVGALREFVDRYHVNALLTPHPSGVVKNPVAQRDTLRAWLAAFDRAAKALDRPGVLFYTYLKDEPNTLEDYRYVQTWGRAVREAKSVVKVLVVEQPWTEPGRGGADSAWGDLYGAVDIWCPLFSLHRPESAARRQALGETVWTYTALCQGQPTPWWHIDVPLLNYRVPAWMAWCDGMKGLLYWGGMSYWRQSEDPWTQAPYYTGSGRPQQGRKGILYHGEGSLVYPARAVGYDGIVPTLRLKTLRDAIEDYEYLAILEKHGKAAEARTIVRSLTRSFFEWEKDAAAYEKARARLAALMPSAASEPRSSPAAGAAATPPASDLRLPDPLLTSRGTPVTSVEMWRQTRRPEILELFRTHVYGRAPVGRPEHLKFETTETAQGVMGGAATRKQVRIAYRGPGGEGAIGLVVFVPAQPRPAPCFLLICNRDATNIDPTRAVKSPFWPAEQIVARGYAAAAFLNADVDPDRHDGFTNGVHGIFDPPGRTRPPDAWGTIAAWAWGASRVMDYLETDPDIDARRVAVIGHSRGGKTALWAGAEDERFALVISNDSGCGGAALARRRQPKAETIAAINRSFPHWFCENYRRYNHREDDLPVDQHMLAALIAPRLLCIASATQDLWADPEGEFLCGLNASPVYRLLGREGLKADRWPPPDSPRHDGSIGYHLRTGKHGLTEYDWTCYLDFADRHLRPPPAGKP